MDGRSGMEGDRERKNTGRKEREREEWVSNERRSRHKVNRYGACSSQGLTALRFVVSTFSPPRFLAPLSSLPSIAAPRADYASPCVGDANRAPLVRRKFAIVAVPSFSILPSPESLRSPLLNPVPARFCAWQWEGERKCWNFVLFFVSILRFLLYAFWIFWIFVVVVLSRSFEEGSKLWERIAGSAVGNHRIVELKMEKHWSVVVVTVETGRVWKPQDLALTYITLSWSIWISIYLESWDGKS